LAHFLDLLLREAQIPEARLAVIGEEACHLTAGRRLPRGDHSFEEAFEPAASLPGHAGKRVGSGDSCGSAHPDLICFFLPEKYDYLGSVLQPRQTAFGKAEMSLVHAVEVAASATQLRRDRRHGAAAGRAVSHDIFVTMDVAAPARASLAWHAGPPGRPENSL
jgi:hypothetical protein